MRAEAGSTASTAIVVGWLRADSTHAVLGLRWFRRTKRRRPAVSQQAKQEPQRRRCRLRWVRRGGGGGAPDHRRWAGGPLITLLLDLLARFTAADLLPLLHQATPAAMACLVQASAALQRPSTAHAAHQARTARLGHSSGGVATRRAAPPVGSGCSAPGQRLSTRLQVRHALQLEALPRTQLLANVPF